MSIESQNTQVSTKDLLWQMIPKLFGVKEKNAWTYRKTFSKENKSWLAKMAGVSETEYAREKTGKYNILIRNNILNNKILPLHEYNENMDKLTYAKETKKTFLGKENQLNIYIANLNAAQIQQLNTLSQFQLVSFLENQLQKIENNKKNIDTKLQQEYGVVADETSENIATMKELQQWMENMDDFLQNNQLDEYVLNKITGKFENQTLEQEYQEYITTGKGAEEYKRLKNEKVNEDELGAMLRCAYMQQSVYNSEKYAKLSDKEKKQFAKMTMEYYTIAQKFQIDLSSFGLENIYIKAREYLAQKFGDQEKEPCHTLINNINADPDMTAFFKQEENTITNLSPIEKAQNNPKDKAYYKKLFLLYPASKVEKSVNKYLEYFNDDMSIKNTLSQDEKKEAESMTKKIQESVQPYEEKLLKKTNSAVQEYAISQCIESLQSYMDIDISEQENLVENFKALTDTDAISHEGWELLFKIHGEMNGKKMTLSYDLISGQIYYHPFLYKNSLNETDPLLLGEKNDRNRLPLTNLPSISKIMQWAQKIDYQSLMTKSDNLLDYTKNIKENMDIWLIFWKNIWFELGQDSLKKQVIQDQIVQNVITCSWRVFSSSEEITKEYPNIYWFYNYLYKSLEYYSMKSIDQLLLFDKNIQTLLSYRNKKLEQQSLEEVTKYKEDDKNPLWTQNQEMFAVQALLHPSIIPPITNIFTEQWPEEYMMKFFKCFEKQVSDVSIVDVEMMSDYFTAAQWTNKTENKVGKWAKNSAFASLISDVDTKISGDEASKDLEAQLNIQDLPEK